MSNNEYLLVLSSLGVYVDVSGRRSREQELMWPSTPVAATYNSPYLTVWCENVAFIYDVNSAEWLQTLPLRRLTDSPVKQLCKNGSLTLTCVSDVIRLVYFRNIYDGQFPLVGVSHGHVISVSFVSLLYLY